MASGNGDQDEKLYKLRHSTAHVMAEAVLELFPEGKLYEFAHREITLPDGRAELEILWAQAKPYSKRITDPETQAALPKALRVCRLNERHGVARMTDHRFIDASSPMVQQSQFKTGLQVTVNFGDEPFTLPDGRTVEARSALVDE